MPIYSGEKQGYWTMHGIEIAPVRGSQRGCFLPDNHGAGRHRGRQWDIRVLDRIP